MAACVAGRRRVACKRYPVMHDNWNWSFLGLRSLDGLWEGKVLGSSYEGYG
jgi:hypothetical protein